MRTTALILSALLVSCGGTTPESTVAPGRAGPRTPYQVPSGSIDAALAGAHRTDRERARDEYRHPKETLEFFGLQPNMTVVEIWPGGGWYTKILAPVVRDEGKLIVAGLDPEDTSFRGRFARSFRDEFLPAAPELYDRVQLSVLAPGNMMDDVPDGSVDLVINPRNSHNMIRWEDHDIAAFLSAVARVLKPGGVYGLVQHRAPDGLDGGESGQLGYVTEALMIRLAEAAGLRLDERSEVNANANDTHDHPDGVWSLPPALRGGDTDREHFLAIGESDRMTLRFVKAERASEGEETTEEAGEVADEPAESTN
ncbi:MAG: methyltransferase domain-containing protein [Myxococcota bacterium]